MTSRTNSSRLGVVAAMFNTALIHAMLEAATDEAEKHGAVISIVSRVPGCYEIPLMVQCLLASNDVDGAVVLGYIEKGETLHGEVMGHVVLEAVLRTSLATRIPIGIGIVGPGATRDQAEARSESHARSAVRASLLVLEQLRGMGS